jgi:hypothetical protein
LDTAASELNEGQIWEAALAAADTALAGGHGLAAEMTTLANAWDDPEWANTGSTN